MAAQDETGGTGLGHRSVSVTREEQGTYLVSNVRGGTLRVGGGGESADFTPVELFLTAMAGWIKKGLTVPVLRLFLKRRFINVQCPEVVFTLRFPSGADGDRARERLPRAIEQSRDRLCTVSRTVQRGADVVMREG